MSKLYDDDPGSNVGDIKWPMAVIALLAVVAWLVFSVLRSIF